MLAAMLFAVLGAAAASEPKKLSQAEAESLVFQSWKVLAIEHNGKKTEGDYGFRFSPDGEQVWLLQGELAPTHPDPGTKILVDASASPMRIDFVSLNAKKAFRVAPGIFMFDKGQLILIMPDGGTSPYRKDGNYPNRPTGFEATNENKYTKRLLKKCEYLEQD
jgi:uncharacterized protein (TIGR03067 family)